MRSIIFTVCFLLSFVSISFSQQLNRDDSSPIFITVSKPIPDIRILILKRLDKYIKSEALFSKPKNSVFLFSIGLSVDSLGNVDDVYFSENVSRNKTGIVMVNENLITDFKKMRIDDFVYRNKILIFPILFKRPEDDKISNLSEFLSSFSSLWPIINKEAKRRVVLLEPSINNFFDPIN